jgi:hypothetical protein
MKEWRKQHQPMRKHNKRKAYDELHPTEQYKRRKLGKEALERIGVPAVALLTPPLPSQLIHLSTANRKLFRKTFPYFHLPSEKKIIKYKQQLSLTHGTETSIAKINNLIIAYLTDPIKFINIITNQSSFISIGIDKGNDTTKIGISYEVNNSIHYAALLISTGKDNYEELNILKTSVLQYKGLSSRYTNIFQILQHIIKDERVNRKVFFSSDLSCTNTILGIKSSSSHHPCPICLVDKKELNKSSTQRDRSVIKNTRTTQNKHSEKYNPLLDIQPTRIVPPSLHIFFRDR